MAANGVQTAREASFIPFLCDHSKCRNAYPSFPSCLARYLAPMMDIIA